MWPCFAIRPNSGEQLGHADAVGSTDVLAELRNATIAKPQIERQGGVVQRAGFEQQAGRPGCASLGLYRGHQRAGNALTPG